MRTGKIRICEVCGKQVQPGGMGGHLRLAHGVVIKNIVTHVSQVFAHVPQVTGDISQQVSAHVPQVTSDISQQVSAHVPQVTSDVSQQVSAHVPQVTEKIQRPSDFIKKDNVIIKTTVQPERHYSQMDEKYWDFDNYLNWDLSGTKYCLVDLTDADPKYYGFECGIRGYWIIEGISMEMKEKCRKLKQSGNR